MSRPLSPTPTTKADPVTPAWDHAEDGELTRSCAGAYKATSQTKVRSSVHDGPLFTAYVYRTANSIASGTFGAPSSDP